VNSDHPRPLDFLELNTGQMCGWKRNSIQGTLQINIARGAHASLNEYHPVVHPETESYSDTQFT